MEHLLHVYRDAAELEAFIDTHGLARRRGLVQVFTAAAEPQQVRPVLERLQALHGFAVIGASTAGAIAGERVHDEGVVLSVSIFEHTQIETRYLPQAEAADGERLGAELAARGVRLLLAFGNILHENPEAFLEGLARTAPDLVVAGGIAADTVLFRGSFVIHGNEVHSRGVVLAALSGERLRLHTASLLNFTPAGKPMRLTRSHGEYVHEIDGKPVLDVYRHYLGEEVLQQIPLSLAAFPLIARQRGLDVARLPVGLSEDGALRFGGTLRPEQPVRFGVGDIFTLLERAHATAQQLSRSVPAEAVYVFSCLGRRLYLGEHTPLELAPLAALAPAAGFFTYGEFFHLPGDNRLLNMTCTLVVLAETDTIRPRPISLPRHLPEPNLTLRALARLSDVTSQELSHSLTFLEQYRYALDQSAIVSRTDLQGRITYVNALFERVSGYRAEELIGHTHRLLHHPDMPRAVYEEIWRTLEDKQIWRGIIQNRSKEGRTYYLKATIIPLFDENGDTVEYIGIAEDITEIIVSQQLLEQQRTDRLTGLPNRNQLIEDLERGHCHLLALADVAAFKSINDYYGFEAGDRLIIELAVRLQQRFQPLGIRVYRDYGAGFAFIPPDGLALPAFEAELLAASRALRTLPMPGMDGEEVDIDLYFGIAKGDDHLLALAEAALHKAKESGVRDRIPVFNAQDQSYLNNRFWINEVKAALAESRILCHFQPIVPVRPAQHPPKYEALVRLYDRQGQILSPGVFLDIVKPTGHYGRLTRRVFDLALEAARRTGSQISINLSAIDLADGETYAYLLDQLKKHQGERLIFEITESEAIEDFARVRAFAEDIRRHGAQLAVDDFGSGYSNLATLIELSPDYLKLDGSLVTKVVQEEKVRRVIAAAVHFAHETEMQVVAEFVSTPEIAQTLERLGVDYLQGYAIGKPISLP